MKKLLAIILSITMLCGLCGCIDADFLEDLLDKPQSDTSDIDDDKDDDKDEDKNDKETNKTDNKVEQVKPEFSLGKNQNNTYRNDFLGIQCTMPKDWEFYSDEQILEINNFTADFFDEDVAEILANATIIYDMYATNTRDSSNMNLNLEKLSPAQLANLDLKKTLEAQFPMIDSTYKNMGYTDISIVYDIIEVDGKEFDGIRLNAKINGVDAYVCLICFRKGSYLTSLTIGSFQTDKTEKILSCFTIE